MRRLYKQACQVKQLTSSPQILLRAFASKRSSRAAKVWPRSAIDRQENFSNDPEILVRTVHEKERFAFRFALEKKELTEAYQIYVEQRELPILSGAEVTSLVQLICADALLRKLNNVDQPQSLKDVFWTVVEDVKEQKVAGQTMLWVHAIDTLVIWESFDEALELWAYLAGLPNRTATDRNDAHCIDSRVYGSAVKLFTALGDMPKVHELYDEAINRRKLTPSLMLEQSMIAALFQSGKIGEAYKTMDKAIREQRRTLRPAFFNAMMALALDAEAVGIATEIFMKACNVQMSPAAAQVTRLLSGLGRLKKDALGSVITVLKHYQVVSNGQVPIEHINTVITAVFALAEDQAGVSNSEVLGRVHQLLQNIKEMGLHPSSSTINILLSGYVALGEHKLVQDLMSRATLNDVSFRTMLKALTRTAEKQDLVRVRELWLAFESHRLAARTDFVMRDLQMVMRAAFRNSPTEANIWIRDLLDTHSSQLDPESASHLEDEFERHESGTFVFGRAPKERNPTARSMQWLHQQ